MNEYLKLGIVQKVRLFIGNEEKVFHYLIKVQEMAYRILCIIN